MELSEISEMNRIIFLEERIINRYDHEHLIILMALVNGIKAGFKVGYGKSDGVFYSAKGGVMPVFRRKGLATVMLKYMISKAAEAGFDRFQFDTFPNLHPEMLILGLNEGFRVSDAGWNKRHSEFRVQLEVSIPDYLHRS